MQKFGVSVGIIILKTLLIPNLIPYIDWKRGSEMIGRKKNFVKDNMEYVIREHNLKSRHVTIKCC